MVKIQIIWTPVACHQELKDSCREVAGYVKSQLQAHFPENVDLKNYDLFDKNCPSIPSDARIPIVIINYNVFSSGEKISVPLIKAYLRKNLANWSLLLQKDGHGASLEVTSLEK